MNLANEGLEARKKEEEVLGKKRKAENDKVWEGMHSLFKGPVGRWTKSSFPDTREQRVDSWRTFSGNKKKKTKTKPVLLG